MALREGELLAGKYRVERVLAQGGMGIVCAAIHTELDQRVALKFLLPEGEADEQARLRFMREAKAAVRLRSEHVARVLDVGSADGAPYIVMEYLKGKDLAEVLDERGRLLPEEAVTYLLQAAEAVAEAHAVGIIHRDLKPANLFLTERPDGSPCVKVLDFGIAKSLDLPAAGQGLTQTTSMVGTPHYMSPEQVRSSKNVDTRSDIWAMGMILYELVTGFVAFSRDTLPELCSSIILDPVPPPRSLVPDLSAELEQAILVTLSKAPEHRPQDLAELAALLAPFCSEGTRAAERIARVLHGRPAPAASGPRLDVRASRPEIEAAPVVSYAADSTRSAIESAVTVRPPSFSSDERPAIPEIDTGADTQDAPPASGPRSASAERAPPSSMIRLVAVFAIALVACGVGLVAFLRQSSRQEDATPVASAASVAPAPSPSRVVVETAAVAPPPMPAASPATSVSPLPSPPPVAGHRRDLPKRPAAGSSALDDFGPRQ
ncbi:MAG: serine/threonine-protein kinase [Labilithrix sp.]